MREKIIVVAAPSGAGKNTFIDEALKHFPRLRDVTTYTTRAMRSGESQGNPYHFIAEDKFKALIDQNFFVEWAKVHLYYYGTSWNSIREAWEDDLAVIMDIDVQGAETFRTKFPQCLCVFIEPPSLQVLKERIIKREGKLPADIEVRMQSAQQEMARASEFKHRIINDDFQTAFAEFRSLLEAYLES